MTNIGHSVRFAHVLGILIIATVCLYTLCVNSEQVEPSHGQTSKGGSGALVLLETNNEEDDDGLVTDDDDGEQKPEEVSSPVEDFEPTLDWKEVKKGQKIPPGLHVRMDFETGQKQAKLMNEQVKKQQWDGGDKIGVINTQQKTRLSRDELKQALKNFKYKEPEETSNKEHKEEVKKKFRTYDELKRVMEEMKLTDKTEQEIVSELLTRLSKSKPSQEEILTILTDLEYYLHQVDSAVVFSDKGGLLTLMALTNSSDEQIRATAAHTLGSALQSNAKVQIAALESGLLQQLLRMLAVDSSLAVRKKTLYALSTLIRQFPLAQKNFISSGGLSALADLFKSLKEHGLQVKIITLLTDLLQEFDFNVNQESSDDPNQAEKSRQYKKLDLRQTLSSSGWCSLMASLVHPTADHDSIEKVITAMSALVSTCKNDFSTAHSQLQGLLESYKQLAKEETEEGDDTFFTSIHSSIQHLVTKLYKDEL